MVPCCCFLIYIFSRTLKDIELLKFKAIVSKARIARQWHHISKTSRLYICDLMTNIIGVELVASYAGYGVSKYQQFDCLFNSWFRLTQKKSGRPVLLALCEGNPPPTGGFPSQKASIAESVSWRHHDRCLNQWNHFLCLCAWHHGVAISYRPIIRQLGISFYHQQSV